MRKPGLIGSLALVLSVGEVLSDSPLLPPERYEVCSPGGRYCAVVDPTSGTAVFHVDNNGARSKLWSLPDWYRDLHIADNGVVVTGYWGLDLLHLADARCGTVILRFWRDGALAREATLCEIVPDLRTLERTASHYYWGSTLGFNADGLFEVATVDERVVLFDASTGKKVGERKQAG